MKKTTFTLWTVLLALTLSFMLIFTLTACNSDNPENETKTEPVSENNTEPQSDVSSGTVPAESDVDETQPDETQTDSDEPEIITVSALIQQSKTNVDVWTTGVVFAKTANGFYMADEANASIFVKGGDATVGDAVLVEGTYRVSAGLPLLNALSVKTTTSDQAVISPADTELAQIAALKGEKNDFSKLCRVHGVLSVDESGHYTITDGQSKVTLDVSKSLDELLNKDVQLTVVTSAYDASNGWTLICVNENDIAETPFDLAGAADEIFAAAAVKDTVTGKLNLVSSLEAYPNVTLTWSTVSGDAIQIENNEAVVHIVESDSASVLKLVLSCGTQTQEKTFNVTVKAPRTIALSEIASVKPEIDETFYVQGVVIAQASNQSGDVLSVVVYGDGAIYRIDLEESVVREMTIGTHLKALVYYDPASAEEGSYDVTALRGISAQKTATETVSVDYSAIPCVTLETEEDFNTLLNTPYTEVTLYKIVNPYLSRSTSADTNFFRFGATEDQSKQGLNKEQYTGFFMRAENGINRNAEILASAKISLPGNTTPVKFDGTTIYAIGVYRGKTTMQFVIPGENCVILSLEATVHNIESEFVQTTFDASAAGEFALPCTDFVTWNCDSSLLQLENNVAKYVKVVGDNQTVTLVGNFTYMGNAESVEIEIVLTGAPIPVYQISDLTEDGIVAKLECVVVGMAPSHGGTISKYSSYGLYVSDGKTIALLSADKTLLKIENGYTFKLGESTVAVGDKLYLTNVSYKASNKTLSAADGFTIAITENDVDTSSFKYEDADLQTTITQLSEFETYVTGDKKKNLKLIKVVADEDHPIYLAAQTGYLLALNYLTDDNKDDTTGNAYKYENCVMTLNVCPFAFVFGEKWSVDNTPIKTIDITTDYGSTTSQQSKDKYTSSTYAFTGTLYLVYEYTTSANYQFTGVLAGSELTPLEK